MSSLYSISPLTGKYKADVKELEEYFSEFAFIKYKLLVEIEYFIALLQFLGKSKVSANPKGKLRKLYQNFSLRQAKRVKKIEEEINHDTKAVEYFLKERLEKTSFKKYKEFVHFGLTSNDIIDNAYSLMLHDATTSILLPHLTHLQQQLAVLAKAHKKLPMLARTHGQPASPTTLGKEFANFATRMQERTKLLHSAQFPGKISGAVGNFNAHRAAYPDRDWVNFAKSFITRLGLKPKLLTTQVMPKEEIADFLHSIEVLNNIILDLDRDIWLYISFGYFKQRTKRQEVGSSTMPHKVNPIDFENSEGNILIANALLETIAGKIQVSRLQRDLSDSTVLRNYGVALGHSLLAYKSTSRGLEKLQPNRKAISRDLEENPQVIAEAIQTILRREGYREPYEKLKGLTRGQEIATQTLAKFINGLDVADKVKKELLSLKPQTYIGLAKELVDLALKRR